MNRVSGPRVPGSEHIPFNPINPHGSRAKMPDGWQSPLREPLYQVFVDDRGKGNIPIGPRIRFDVATQLCATVHAAIRGDKIHGWSNPTVLPAARVLTAGLHSL